MINISHEKYKDWIQNNVTESYGKCAEVTERMAEVFPELKRVRGHYYCSVWGERGHWWLIAPDGKVIDPTADQFPTKGTGVYTEWDESQAEPTGKCPNCGGYCYNGDHLCSNECGDEYVAYLSG